MIHRHMSTLLTLLAVAFAASCTSERAAGSGTAEVSVGSTYDALATKLKDCGHSKRACIDASECEPAALTICADEFTACGDAARVEEQALRAATEACRLAEDACREAAPDRDAEDACRQDRKTCMRASQPEEPPCHAGLRTCLETARADESDSVVVDEVSDDDDADDAGVEPGPGRGPKPTDPTLAAPEPGKAPKPRAHKPPTPKAPRPESTAERACHEQARACMTAEVEAEPGPGEHLHCHGEEGPVPPLPEPPPPAAGGPALPPPPAAGVGGAF